MKQRLITAGIGIAVAIVAVAFSYTPILNVTMALICAAAVFEIVEATKASANKFILVVALLYGALVTFFADYTLIFPITLAYGFLMMLLLLISYRIVRYEQISFIFMMSFLVAASFGAPMILARVYPLDFVLYFLLMLGGCWFSDTFAYFIGSLFGKHKLCPFISPKKTVEGAVAGVISTVLLSMLTAFVYSLIVGQMGRTVGINYFYVALIGFILSLLSMVGDLFASIIKRQCGIKDFGTVLPGHGGIMDRFDSTLIVMPTAVFLFHFLPILSNVG